MNKPMTVAIQALFVIFGLLTIWSVLQWILGNSRAWISLIGCAIVTVYTWFLINHFGYGKYKPKNLDDD